MVIAMPVVLARLAGLAACAATVGFASAGEAPSNASAPEPASHNPSSAAHDAAAKYFRENLPSAQSQFTHCMLVQSPNPGYEGREILRCNDAKLGLPGVIYVMNPTADNLAQRVGRACSAIGLGDSLHCGERLAAYIVSKNGGQFPVAGQVIETGAEMRKGGDNVPRYEEFRDGVTVKTEAKLTGSRKEATPEALEQSVTAPVIKVYSYGRVANGSEADFKKAGGELQAGHVAAGGTSDSWPVTVRENEKHAQDTGDDVLLNGVAIGLRQSLVN